MGFERARKPAATGPLRPVAGADPAGIGAAPEACDSPAVKRPRVPPARVPPGGEGSAGAGIRDPSGDP